MFSVKSRECACFNRVFSQWNVSFFVRLFFVIYMLLVCFFAQALRTTNKPSVDAQKLSYQKLTVSDIEFSKQLGQQLSNIDEEGQFERDITERGKVIDLDINLLEKTSSQKISKDQKAWAIELTSPGADSVYVKFSFDVPKSGRFHIYSDDVFFEFSPHSDLGHLKQEQMQTLSFEGDSLLFIYTQDAKDPDPESIVITDLIHSKKMDQFEKDDPELNGMVCNENPVCNNMNYYEALSKAVVSITINTEDNQNNTIKNKCTGTLLNSNTSPKRSFILTAGHCIENIPGILTPNLNKTYTEISFILNFKTSSCNSLSTTSSGIHLGTKILSYAYIDYKNEVDYALLEYEFPDLYLFEDVNYAGWTADPIELNLYSDYDQAIWLHHPQEQPMQITVEDGPIHRVDFDYIFIDGEEKAVLDYPGDKLFVNQLERGYTHKGSSGSGMFSASNQKLFGVHTNVVNLPQQCAPTNSLMLSHTFYDMYEDTSFGYPSIRSHLEAWFDPLESPTMEGFYPKGPISPFIQPPWIYEPTVFELQNGQNLLGELVQIDDLNEPPLHCYDSVINGDEVWLNCGGSCAPCDYQNNCYADLTNATLDLVSQADVCFDPKEGYHNAYPDTWHAQKQYAMEINNVMASCPMHYASIRIDGENGNYHSNFPTELWDADIHFFPSFLYHEVLYDQDNQLLPPHLQVREWLDPDGGWPWGAEIKLQLVHDTGDINLPFKYFIGGEKKINKTVYLRSEKPNILNKDIAVCPGQSTQLFGEVAQNHFFHWQGHSELLDSAFVLNPIFTPDQPGDYVLELVGYRYYDEDHNICTNSDVVNVQTIELQAVDVPKLEVGIGEQVELIAPLTGDEGVEDDFNYSWTSTFNQFQSDERNPVWTAPMEPENNFKLTVAVDGPGVHTSCNNSFELWADIKDGACHVEVTPLSSDTVKVQWQDCTGDGVDVNYYTIKRWIDDGWELLGNVPGNQLSFWDYDVPVGTEKLKYMVIALKQDPDTNQNIGSANGAKSAEISMESFVFSEYEWNGLDHVYGNISFADVDLDNDLDVYFSMFYDVDDLPESRFHENDEQGIGFSNWIAGNGLPEETFSVTTWGDYNRDGYPDALVSGGLGSDNLYPTVYRNNGGNSFTKVFEADNELLKSGVWGDFNGDDFLDFLVTGCSGTKIYYQQSNGLLFTGVDEGLPSINISHTIGGFGAVAGDMDNDGDLDLLFMGADCDDGSPKKRQYRNNGDGDWSPIGLIEIPEHYIQSTLKNSAGAFGDYNGDGLLDLVIAGERANGTLRTEVYRKPSTFEHYYEYELVASLPGVKYPQLSWADYDNDGDLDLLVGGEDAEGVWSQSLYKNMGNDQFSKVEVDLGSSRLGHAWADMNNDGVLDLYNSQYVYLNHMPDNADEYKAKNTPPEAPSWMGSYVEGNDRIFVWGPGSDQSDETPVDGLSYDLRIWNPNTMKWVRPGSKYFVGRGGIQGTSWRLKGGASLPEVSDWEVATVDAGYTKSVYLSSNNLMQPPLPEYAMLLPDPDDYPLCKGTAFHVDVQPKAGQVGPAPSATDFTSTDPANTVEKLSLTQAKVVRHQECDDPYCYLEITADLEFNGSGSQQIVGGIEVPGKNGVYDTVVLDWIEHEGDPAVRATLMPPTNGGKEADHIYWLTPPEGIQRIGDYHSDSIIFKVQEGYQPEALCGVQLTVNATHECGPDGNFYASGVFGEDPISLEGEVHMVATPDVYGQVDISWQLEGQQSIIVMREAAAVTQTPLINQNYNASSVFSEGDDLGDGNYIVYKGIDSEVTVTGMTPGMSYEIKQFVLHEDISCYPTDYYYFGSASSELASCPVWEPGSVEIDIELLEMNPGNGELKISWTPDQDREWVVLMRYNNLVDMAPTWGENYAANLVWGQGEDIGQQTYVMYQGSETELIVTGLAPGEHYSVKVFGSRTGIAGCYDNDYYFGDADWVGLSLANPQDDLNPGAASYVFSEPQGAYEAVCQGGMAAMQLQQVGDGESPESIVYTLEDASGGQISGQNTYNVKTYSVSPIGTCALPQNSCAVMGSCYTVNAELTFNINNEEYKQYVSKNVAAYCGPCQEW